MVLNSLCETVFSNRNVCLKPVIFNGFLQYQAELHKILKLQPHTTLLRLYAYFIYNNNIIIIWNHQRKGVIKALQMFLIQIYSVLKISELFNNLNVDLL